jgi:hypothetical protein
MARFGSIVALCLALAMSACALGDTVRFVNGTSVQGTIERRGDYVTIRTSDGQLLRVRRALVASIEGWHGLLASRALAPVASPPPRPSPSQGLNQILTVDFQQMPLTDVVQYLRTETGLNFVIDPDVKADEILITLSLKDMSLVNILRWIAQVGKLAIVVKGEGRTVRIAGKTNGAQSLARYDGTPLLLSLIDRPAQPFDLAEGSAHAAPMSQSGFQGASAGFRRSAKGRDTQDIDLQRRGHDLLELLVRSTGAQNWDHAFVSGRLPERDYLAGD